ncbi:hypothetical protein MKK88_10995 [Methylobacterium sp. E-005]|uniref:hypothetical protein n=1 Tax=Methylobacterium sp. E-005 TaxID=2836549 RepID=UPI001FBB1A8C|nr:hypothetical protein [Methylobacterium sp. E-005]MCJ2086513.1 hypothetical protein [Methylobacterium sp. E-005]
MADLDGKGATRRDYRHSAPSWQDYLDALSIEGRRYRPASLSKTLEDREAAGGNPRQHANDKRTNGGER